MLLVTVGLIGYTGMEAMRSICLEDAINEADRMGETIIRTTLYHMLENKKDRAYQEINEIGKQQQVERIRIINKNGRITFSTLPEEIGTILDKKASACNMCHKDHQVLVLTSSMSRSRLFVGPEGHQVLGIAKAIYNQPNCSNASCHQHSPSERILGVLDIVLSMKNMHHKTASYRNRVAVIGVILVIAVIICITFMTEKLVNDPLKRLLRHTERVARGALNISVEVTSRDELGELADAFNRMTQSLKKARDELEEWGRTLEARVIERTREVEEMQAQLIRAEKMASLGQLAAGIAHEINNPLTGVLSFAFLVRDDTRLDPSLKPDMDVIIEETQRCAKIVKGLLEFSRARAPLKKEVCLNELIESVTSLLERQSSFLDIAIIKEFDPDLPRLPVDPNQLQQVFMNMFVNASHAMPDGGRITVRTNTDRAGKCVSVEIADTGCGIPEENLGRIFDPFYTTKKDGTGLGLSISYGIIRNHGGQIDVKSEVGEGTTFIIRLPIPDKEVECPQQGIQE